jgi:glycosyltransferase involved in cell wall biosynthesis
MSFTNIGIVTFNRLGYTQLCIEAVLKTIKQTKYKITVVDNASTDGTIEYLKQLYSEGKIHNLCLMNKNVGVAKAANTAWLKEPKANYFLKLDNDMIATKENWLEDMIYVIEHDKNKVIGTLGYNVEVKSYPINCIVGDKHIRVKENNLGGACLFIPKRTEELIGNFNEAFGLYGEEDADYFFRLHFSNRYNAYMEDENCFFHLPSGKAAVIETESGKFIAKDGLEEINEKEYRAFKDSFRATNVPKVMKFIEGYQNKTKSLKIISNANKDFKFRWFKG